MKAKEIDKVSRPRQIAVIASVLLLLGAAFQAYQLFTYYSAFSSHSHDIDDENKRKQDLELLYNKEVQRKKDLGFDIELIQSALAVHRQLDEKNIKSLDLFYNIGLALGTEMRIDVIDIKRGEKPQKNWRMKEVPKVPLFEATMRMTFPSTTNPEKGNEEVDQLQSRLQTIMPDHVVKVTKKLEDYEYVDEIVVQTGDASGDAKKADFIAEIKIEGPEL